MDDKPSAAEQAFEERKQEWAEAVIECVSDNAERERLIRLYDYDELVKACLALGTLALTAKHEYQRAERADAAATERTARRCVEICRECDEKNWDAEDCGVIIAKEFGLE